MASISTNKRRRTTADTLHISDLPVGFIVNVAEYLPKPTRAILAATLSAPSSSWKSDLMHRLPPISTAIVSASKWDILDFEDINKELANKLTDDDISAVLKSINAHDVLKRLNLCGCINITGIGLSPLLGSVVLEQIDLSLLRKFENHHIRTEPKIYRESVVVVLDSIGSADGCSLKYIQFPLKWKDIGTHDDSGEIYPAVRFVRIFSTRLTNRRLCCSKCNRNMRYCHQWFAGNLLENTKICYECLEPTCDTCQRMNGSATFCQYCSKKYCTGCIDTLSRCTSCSAAKCGGCGDMEACDECEEATCEDCLRTCSRCNTTRCNQCVEVYYCEGDNCNKAHCQDCYSDSECSIKYCEECESLYCSDCKFVEFRDFGVRCNACTGDVAHLIAEEMGKIRKKNEELGKENERMGKENDELRKKIEGLSL